MDNRQPKGSKYQKKRRGMGIKVYLIYQRTNIASREQPHTRLIDARLSYKEAEEVRDLNPGSYIQKIVATKKPKHAEPKGVSDVKSPKPIQDS